MLTKATSGICSIASKTCSARTMRRWPAVDVAGVGDDDASELVLALIDEFNPTAAQQADGSFRLFFETPTIRDRALDALASAGRRAVALDVGDEDWARRSQQNLDPVTVGRIIVFPDPASRIPDPHRPNPQSPIPNPIPIVIVPSMGFGTGHHATTRLCLAALQQLDVDGRRVVD